MDIFYRKKIHRTDGTEVEYIEGGCLSNETKPVKDFVITSKAIEADTGMVYFFAGKDAETPWVPQFSFKQDEEEDTRNIMKAVDRYIHLKEEADNEETSNEMRR